MSLNIDNVGKKICIIKDDPKFNKTIISLSEDEENNELVKPFKELHLQKGVFQWIPDKTDDRFTAYICGAAGSGKSHVASKMAIEYHNIFKNNPIYLISEGKDDPLFDNLKYINRIQIDEELLEEPIDYADFNNCLCIFDDIDAISGKLGKYLYILRDKLLKNSRKSRVSVISTNHACTGKDVQAVLNESQIICFFMKNYNRSLKYLLESYVGLNKDGIKALKKNKSRWTMYIKTFPNVILQERDLMTIDKIQDF